MSAETTDHPYEPSDLGDYPVVSVNALGHSYARIHLGRPVVRALGLDVSSRDRVRVDDADGAAVAMRPGTNGEICDHSCGDTITCGPRVVDALGAGIGDRVAAVDRGDHVRLELVDKGGDDA